MKKFSTTVCLLALGAMSAFGAQVSVCQGVGTGSTISLATAQGTDTYLCGDKIFSNFTSSGGVDGAVSIASLAGSNYRLSFLAAGDGHSNAFTLGFNVAIDVANFPTWSITQVQDSMLTNRAAGGDSIANASTATVTHTPGGVVNLNALTAPNQNGLVNIASTTEGILFAYNPTGTAGVPAGNFLSIDFVISQTNNVVPEPMTFSLIGAGLLGLGLFGRRRMVKQ